ncbi:peptidoglycan-binding protein, partial [Planctomycetota bacterium]
SRGSKPSAADDKPSPKESAKPEPAESNSATLRQGARGEQVQQLQEDLRKLGFLSGAADGAFGPQTKSAVVAFQKARGLAADGIVGPQTRKALSAG